MTATETCQAADIGVEFINDFVRKYAPRDGSSMWWPSEDFQPTVFDYKLIAGAIRLRAALPPSHAPTSIMKTLRGTAVAKVCQNRPEYGMAEGMKVYKNKAIFGMIEQVQSMLKSGDVSEDDECNVDRSDPNADWAPCFVANNLIRTNKEWAVQIAEAFEACGEEFGAAAPEPVKKKSKAVKVKTEVLWETIDKAGILPAAGIKGRELCDAFIEQQTLGGELGEDERWMYHDWAATGVRSKVSKDDHIVVKFYLGHGGILAWGDWRSGRISRVKPRVGGNPNFPWTRVTAEDNYAYFEKAPVLVAKMSLDGTQVIEWSVTLEKYKSDY